MKFPWASVAMDEYACSSGDDVLTWTSEDIERARSKVRDQPTSLPVFPVTVS